MNKKQTLPLHIQSWLLALLSPFNAPQPGNSEAVDEAGEMVESYASAFFSYSLDDERVLLLLLSGEMNARAAEHLSPSSFYCPSWFTGQLGRRYSQPKNDDFEGQLMTAVTAAGGWPTALHRHVVSTVAELRDHYPCVFSEYDLDFLKAAEALQ